MSINAILRHPALFLFQAVRLQCGYIERELARREQVKRTAHTPDLHQDAVLPQARSISETATPLLRARNANCAADMTWACMPHVPLMTSSKSSGRSGCPRKWRWSRKACTCDHVKSLISRCLCQEGRMCSRGVLTKATCRQRRHVAFFHRAPRHPDVERPDAKLPAKIQEAAITYASTYRHIVPPSETAYTPWSEA